MQHAILAKRASATTLVVASAASAAAHATKSSKSKRSVLALVKAPASLCRNVRGRIEAEYAARGYLRRVEQLGLLAEFTERARGAYGCGPMGAARREVKMQKAME